MIMKYVVIIVSPSTPNTAQERKNYNRRNRPTDDETDDTFFAGPKKRAIPINVDTLWAIPFRYYLSELVLAVCDVTKTSGS